MAAANAQDFALGPVEYVVVEFPGNNFKGELVPALVELVQSNTIRILDLLFVRTNADGSFEAMELMRCLRWRPPSLTTWTATSWDC